MGRFETNEDGERVLVLEDMPELVEPDEVDVQVVQFGWNEELREVVGSALTEEGEHEMFVVHRLFMDGAELEVNEKTTFEDVTLELTLHSEFDQPLGGPDEVFVRQGRQEVKIVR